ncbi:hypothetical protein [Candidatus Sulfurimonas baltica]|uniref:Glycosyltransferase subfamily 4-like N-terminal domain-containing protein n=1 Tax=Candidatus Sulfurimonas baltica TaxID=2740404 RepID=A0A7S7LWE1_9BACT|nr:hypothetical protein [Candidatus Sulfurimonas baltica]QOY52688.1 hypothetical protein HUE88_03075 [Candidatus Sulfurimonas baltica]
MKKILIVSYNFYPEINPRSFRTFELAKSLSKIGHSVDIVIPKIDFDYAEIEKKFNFKIHLIDAGFFLNPSQKNIKTKLYAEKESKHLNLKKIIKLILNCIYLGGRSFEYAFTLFRFLKNLPNSYDMIISISFPISVHLGTRWYLSGLHNKPLSVADSGDPFSFNPEIKPKCFYFKILEKYILKPFDYIAIPTSEALGLYKFFKSEDKIKIIPQSFDYKSVKIKSYKKNKIPTFGYAGIFYKNIRNPKTLFDFLLTLKNVEFKFIIFTNTESKDNMELILKYKSILGDKLEVHPLLPREECIYELSGMDFIINQDNINSEQKPSKVIDYMVTMRPIFNFDQNHFDQNKLLQMFCNNKCNTFKINDEYHKKLKKFDSVHVANLFLKLLYKDLD